MFPIATSLIQSVGRRDSALDRNTWVKRTTRLGECPSQTPIGRARLNPFESIRHGRPFGGRGSILCDQSRVQGRDPPVFSAGSTGKSLITYSSIQHRVGLDKVTSVLTAKVLPFVDQNLSAIPAPEYCTPFSQSLGSGFTGCGQGKRHPNLQQFPRRRSGEKYLNPRGAGPGEQGSRPQVSRKWKPW